MTDIRVENYKKNVERAVERWNGKIAAIGRKAKVHREELKKLEAIASPTADDKKQIAEHKQELEKLSKEVDKATTELKVDMMLLDGMPKGAPKADLVKLPDWLKGVIKAKGIPLGNGVAIAPEAKFDFDNFKITYLGIKVTW